MKNRTIYRFNMISPFKSLCQSAKAFLFLLIILFFNGCVNNYTPKPRGFFRIDFPKKEYQTYTGECPFSFDFPTYAVIEKDASAYAEPCWMNVSMKQFKATVHLSYKSLGNLNKLVEDSRGLVYKHTVKADAIEETILNDPQHKIYGTFYNLRGNTASAVQFYLTDSSKHFLRGALYFYTVPQADSLAPVLSFIKQDIDVMIKTFRWKAQ